MSRINVWCDSCGELINENEENRCVVYKPLMSETLCFCNDDCLNDFVREYSEDRYMDIKGRLIED